VNPEPVPCSLNPNPRYFAPCIFPLTNSFSSDPCGLGMACGHLVGDPAGSCETPPPQVVLGQGVEIVHIVRVYFDGPAQSHFGLLVFAQVIVENPEVVVHPGSIGDAAGGERQMPFGLDIFLFLGQQQPSEY